MILFDKYIPLLLAGTLLLPASAVAEVMTAADLGRLTNPPGYTRIYYGDDPLQFGDLRLPASETPAPVAIIIHGGCYLAQYSLDYMGDFAAAVTAMGFASWNIEYRRVGDPGGGWPGTFLDVAAATDFLRELKRHYPIDLDRITVIGHSSGGHLAIWLAARDRIRENSDLYRNSPLPVQGVLPLAPVTDIARRYRQGNCNNSTEKLMGGAPGEHDNRYRQVSPIELLPLPVPQFVLLGDQDTQSRHEETAIYRGKALRLNSVLQYQTVTGSGHFELIDPATPSWLLVKRALRRLQDKL